MKVAIIGAGWVGCHLALKLRDEHEVVLYEKDGVFSQTSLKNQNRLHLGFHYARSSKTRDLCRQTFTLFLDEYSHLVSDIENNIYSVPVNGSTIDFETYAKIFEGWEYETVDLGYLVNVENSIKVNEKYIDPVKSKNFFEEKLKDIIVYKTIYEKDFDDLSTEFDLVINCTNNTLNRKTDVLFELNTLLVYKKIGEVGFGALTFVDGDLFSIFPYLDDTYLVSHVRHSPDATLTDYERVNLTESNILEYYPQFKECFELVGYNKSFKSKVKNSTAPRIPVINQQKNVINVFTGKIQGIFEIESYVLNELKKIK